MLKWYEENGKHLGFVGDTLRYRVAKDDDGWSWEDSYGFGYGGLNTAEQAKADAEEDYRAQDLEIDWEDLEDLEDAYWDAVAHERMEIAKGLL